MEKYEEMKRPYWKRLDYTPSETIEQKEYILDNLKFLNMDQEGITIIKYSDERPQPYRGDRKSVV